MGAFVKAFAIGLATYYGYRAADQFIIKPLVAKVNVPGVSGLLTRL